MRPPMNKSERRASHGRFAWRSIRAVPFAADGPSTVSSFAVPCVLPASTDREHVPLSRDDTVKTGSRFRDGRVGPTRKAAYAGRRDDEPLVPVPALSASEFLRADYRGTGRLSAYQWMALAGLAMGLASVAGFRGSRPVPVVHLGLGLLTSPVALGALAAIGLAGFVYLGVSRVTTASIRLEVLDP
jgi:hypothetical protein